MPQFLQAVTRFNAYPDANLVAEARASLAQQYHPGQAAARPPPAMPAAYSIVSNLGCLLFLERSEPQAAEELTAAVRHLREAIGGRGLEIECTSRGLRLNRVPIPAGCPGAVEVTEQFLHQGLTAIRFPTTPSEEDLRRLARALAAAPGAYPSFEHFERALGADFLARARLEQTAGESPLVRQLASAQVVESDPAVGDEEDRASAKSGGPLDDVGLAVSAGSGPMDPAEVGPSIEKRAEDLLARGRKAIDSGDWAGLLDATIDLLEAESEALTESESEGYRRMLSLLTSQRHLAMLARLATEGEQKQEALVALRRLGPPATRVLMDLLAEAMTLGERRGYYNALTHMSDGTDAIVEHLEHPQWYVVRNAADLCGEMDLAQAVPALARQVAHPDERVRRAVAGALARICTPLASEPLLRALCDSSVRVRREVLTNLDGRRASGLVGRLTMVLDREPVPELQQELLRALGRIGSAAAIKTLREYAAPPARGRKPSPGPLRLAAVHGLELAGLAGEPGLRALRQDPDPEVRRAVESALLRRGAA